MLNPKTLRHIPVLLSEALDLLEVRAGRSYIDATVGEGGHAGEIVKKGGRVLAIDRDRGSLRIAERNLWEACPALKREVKGEEGEQTLPFTIVQGNFKDIRRIAETHGFSQVSGILFDLGISTAQLESAKRGLSFTREGPLDMRLDRSQKRTAQDIVNSESQRGLYEIFTRNAQEELARPISQAIVSARRLKPIETTTELANLVSNIYDEHRMKTKIHPATKVFLAVRMEVNQEAENLRRGLEQAIGLLEMRGRLVVISFNETEDRMVKTILKRKARERKLSILTKKPVTPSQAERERNPRSRSAKLRAASKVNSSNSNMHLQIACNTPKHQMCACPPLEGYGRLALPKQPEWSPG